MKNGKLYIFMTVVLEELSHLFQKKGIICVHVICKEVQKLNTG